MDDPDSDLRWLTYDEAAAVLKIKSDSVRRRASARKWPRRNGNDGLARVGIPVRIIPDQPEIVGGDATPGITPDNPDRLAELMAHLAAAKTEADGLRDRLADAHAERDRLAQMMQQLLEARTLESGRSGFWSWLTGRR